MPTRRSLAALLLACSGGVLAGSPYRLHHSTSPEALVDARSYRLTAEHRPADPAVGPFAQAPPAAAELAAMPYAREVEAAARKVQLDAALVHAVIHVESRHQPKAVSPKGAIGLMQVLPDTAARYGIRDPGRSPQVNLRAGTLYLRDLMDLFDHRLDLVLAAYNAGEGAVIRHAMKIPPYAETRQYVRDVLDKYRSWRGGDPPPGPPAASAIDYLPGTRLTRTASWR